MKDGKLNYIENEFVKIELKNDIIFLTYKKNVKRLDIYMAKKFVVEPRLKINQGKSYPMIVDLNNTLSIDKETREYFASPESLNLVTAGALVVKSWVQKHGTNLFYKINKPQIKTKAFNNIEDAISWINEVNDLN